MVTSYLPQAQHVVRRLVLVEGAVERRHGRFRGGRGRIPLRPERGAAVARAWRQRATIRKLAALRKSEAGWKRRHHGQWAYEGSKWFGYNIMQ